MAATAFGRRSTQPQLRGLEDDLTGLLRRQKVPGAAGALFKQRGSGCVAHGR